MELEYFPVNFINLCMSSTILSKIIEHPLNIYYNIMFENISKLKITFSVSFHFIRTKSWINTGNKLIL